MHIFKGYLLLFLHIILIFSFSYHGQAEDNVGNKDSIVENKKGLTNQLNSEQQAVLEKNAVTYSFQAEVSRLLDTIINSLYTEKDVFLRELISNSVDGLEKARFNAVGNPKYLEKLPKLQVFVSADKQAKTLTIHDTGVGMTKDELVANLGTVAQSGTTNFLEALANGTDINLIGQFGVGFYSAFLVANKVTVTSKSESDPKQHIWQSSATNSFIVSKDPRGPTLVRGTSVTLGLRDDMLEFLNENILETTILKYNQYVTFPIYLLAENKTVTTNESANKTDIQTNKYWKQVNLVRPLWLRSKDNITQLEYDDFFKSLTHSFESPLGYAHFVGEGEIEFKSIIYIPKYPAEGYSSYFETKQSSIKLYSRRVLVASSFYNLIPKWMNFIKGVVDSDDLPLKVDRESLSQTRVLKVIARKIVSKFFDTVNTFVKEDKSFNETAVKPASQEKKYDIFWNGYRKQMKIGCIEDDANRDKIAKLLRFTALQTGPDALVSLEEYLKNLPKEQKKIYYITSDNYDAAISSPYMKIYMKKNFNVLILTDPVDEPCFDRLIMYEGKPIVSIEKTGDQIELTEEEKSLKRRITTAYKPLLDLWKKNLKDCVSNVQISMTLVDAPAAILSPKYGHSGFSDRVLRSQTFGDYQTMREKTRTLAINPHHPLLQKLRDMAIEEPDNPQIEKIGEIICETATISSGYIIPKPSFLASQMFELLQSDLGLSKNPIMKDFVPDANITDDASSAAVNEDQFQDFPNFSPDALKKSNMTDEELYNMVEKAAKRESDIPQVNKTEKKDKKPTIKDEL